MKGRVAVHVRPQARAEQEGTMAAAVGRTIEHGPIPLVEEETTFIPAGVLEFGYGNRVLDNSALARAPKVQAAITSERTAEEAAEVLQRYAENPISGLAVHVREASTHREYLRFDLFDEGPHYHYIYEADVKQTIVDYDVDANGPVIPWALDRLRSRLPALLTRIGRPDLARQIDPALVASAVTELEAGLAKQSAVTPAATA